MTEKQKSEEPVVEQGRYTEPREKSEPGHRDAGQIQADRLNEDAAEDERKREKA